MTPLAILVAEDEENIRLLLEQWLKPMGHTVACAANATEAIKLLAGQSFDLVVTDIVMPDGDGLKLIEELKKAQPIPRILAISGGGRFMDSESYLKMARGFGADAAIMKPFVREKFLAAIAQALAPKKSPPG